MSILGDIVGTYRNPARVMVRRLTHSTEAKALMTLMAACVLIFVSTWPKLARNAHVNPDIPFEAWISGSLMVWVFFAPLLAYGVCGLIWLAIRAAGRPPSGLAIRVTFFWSLLAATPLWLGYGIASGFRPGAVGTTLLGVLLLVTVFYFVISGISVVLKLRSDP